MTTDVFGTSTAIPSETPSTHRTGRRMLSLGIGASAAIAMFLGGMAGTASADTADGSTPANVDVTTSITLAVTTGDFTLTGIPGATVAADDAVILNVETNNLAGYGVTVQATASSLTQVVTDPVHVNTDSIPIANLGVREGNSSTSVGTFAASSFAAPVAVHTQPTRSAELGDTILNDYQIAIPFVNQDTYTVELNYVATTL